MNATLLVYNVNGPDPEACICLLVCDGLLVTLSPLFLEDDLHLALCVFNDGRADPDFFWRNDRVAAHGVFTRADLVDLREREDIAYADVLEAGDCEEVAGRKEVLAAGDRGNDIMRGLGADERKGTRGRGRCLSGLGVQSTVHDRAQGRRRSEETGEGVHCIEEQ